MVILRTARFDDVEKMTEVLRRSITELCVPDHKNDQATLSKWLANKTSDNARRWIASPNQRVAVAIIDEEVVGVGAATNSGEVLLNYVSPDFRSRGVSTAVIADLEAYMAAEGARVSTLISTVTAEKFYQKVGYTYKPPVNDDGAALVERRMWKKLPNP